MQQNRGVVVTGGTGAASAAIRYRLLGRVEVVLDGVAVPVAGRAQRQLLAVLLLRRSRLVPSASLVDLLWEDQPPVDPAGALRSQIARLRRALAQHRGDLVSSGGGYAMVVDASTCDAGRFVDLVARSRAVPPLRALPMLDEALALWRESPLSVLADLGSSFRGEAVHLDELRLEAEERRADQLITLRREGDAVAPLVQLLDAAPQRERARALLMEALYRTGRHTEALSTYEVWRRHLAEDRGLEPSPELRRLEADILNHRLAYRPDPIPPDPVGPPSAPRVAASTFVGRQVELVAVGRALQASRLVTLTGPGGVGKTRLATEVIRRLDPRYADRAIWCDLAGVRTSGEVALAVAVAAGLRQWTGDPIEEQLFRHLRGERCVLVLDNCEHVVDGAASIAGQLTTAPIEVTVLATSRKRLLVDGETVVAISPLAVDGDRSPAAALFVDRARAAGVQEPLGAASGGLLSEVCRKLDGLPLAIELAAARVRGLSLAELAEALDQRFELLDLGPRCRARHRSMRAVVDWSYDELPPVERHAFERLCTFTGTFFLADATALLAAAGVPRADVPCLVANLVERSLLVRRGDHTASRYSMLETLRMYGLERLVERGEDVRARADHAAWVLGVACEAAHGLGGPSERWWVARLDDLFDDLRVAQRWFVGNDPQAALRLCDALHPYAVWRSRSEVFSWMEAAVASAEPSPLAGRVLASVCAGAWQRGDLAAADKALSSAVAGASVGGDGHDRRIAEQEAELALLTGRTDHAAELFRQSAKEAEQDNDGLQAVWDLGSAALALAYGGRQEAAEACAADTIELADHAGSPSARAFARFAAGEVVSSRSPAEAVPLLRAATELAGTVGNTMVAGLAGVAMASVLASFDPLAALRQHEEVILNWQRSSCWTSQWVTLRNVAVVLASVGRAEEAAMLHAAVVSARAGAPAFGRDEAVLEALRGHLAAILGPGQMAALRQRSSELGNEEVVALALGAIRGVLGLAEDS